MVKESKKNKKQSKKSTAKKSKIILFFYLLLLSCLSTLLIFLTVLILFEKKYQNKIYPGIRIDNIPFGGKSKQEAKNFFAQKSIPFEKLKFTLFFEDQIATISGSDLKVSFDSDLSALQAYSVGRSGYIFSDFYQKWLAKTKGINILSVLRFNTDFLDEMLDSLAISIDIEPQEALFKFENGKVTAFKLGKPGQKLDKTKTKNIVLTYINKVAQENQLNSDYEFTIALPVEQVQPVSTTESTNNFGIRELLGKGESTFLGSITSRIHNIELAASRLNGHLVAPGETFSFNNALGDVSSSTGFQPAYIIKDGRTVLGDGGGVCQISTTLFRAALNSGLAISERHPHSYRVSYYEQNSPPGLDATVYAPSYDLKIKNDTDNYILIQAFTDTPNKKLTFEIYGTGDGREVEITKPVILSQSPPPPDLYQDDPTLPKGVVKQVDWKAWGAKVNFDYKVTRNNDVLTQQSFFSNFRPWQAVFLRGTRE